MTTIGHGTLDASAFVALAHQAGIELVLDIRSFPGSRRVPHFARAALEAWLPGAGIAYRWEPDLGGRRKPVPSSRHLAWVHPAFRAYADHMETTAFGEAIAGVVEQAPRAHVALMCSESVWWRCHRRLVADHLELVCATPVVHLFHDGRMQRHSPMPAARVAGAHLVYDIDTLAGPHGEVER